MCSSDLGFLKVLLLPEEELIFHLKQNYHYNWRTYGCASAIASTSMFSEMVVGMTLDQAYNIKAKDILKNLDGLPDNKVHCSVLGDKALRAAIDDYYRKNGMVDGISLSPMSLAALHRLSPATISYPLSAFLRTIGWISPCSFMESASS